MKTLYNGMDGLRIENIFMIITPEKFKKIRLKTGLQREQVCHLLDIHLSSLSNIERGAVKKISISFYRLLEIFPHLDLETKRQYVPSFKRTLKLTLEKHWFSLYQEELKKHEYRLKKTHWESRLKNKDGSYKEFDHVEFTNGYKRNSPKITLEFKGTEEISANAFTPENQEPLEADEIYFRIEVGNIVRTNCDTIKKRIGLST